jgi:hypothetical protein
MTGRFSFEKILGDYILAKDDIWIEEGAVGLLSITYHLCDITDSGLFMMDDILPDDGIDSEYGCLKITSIDEL